MDVLPDYVLLKLHDNDKYLYHSPSKEHKGTHSPSLLRFSDQKVDDGGTVSETEKIEPHHLRFEVQQAKTAKGLAHIRTCYNNKYWVRKSKDSNQIVAEANEPEEDQSKWYCTLFKPVFMEADLDADVTDTRKMRLLHVGELNHGYVGINNSDDEFHLTKIVNPTDATIFIAINAESIAILPEYVALMGPNGKYLAAYLPDHGIVTSTANDVTELGVPHRISIKNQQQGIITVFNVASNLYWATEFADVRMVFCTKDYPPVEVIPIKVGDNIGLKSVIRNTFGHIKEIIKVENALCIDAQTISEDARFKVAEPVYSREILDVSFRLNDARVYNTSIVDKFTDSRSNYTDVTQTGSFQVSYKESQTMTWKQSTTVHIGVKASWSAGIPYVGKLGVDVSYDHTQTIEYGKTENKEKNVTYSQSINIPPGNKVTLKVVASKAYCDVPFTCKVRDTMFDGSVREYDKTDGLYVGCNEFDFNTVISEDHL